jgi:Family of unknown function (DUF6338)
MRACEGTGVGTGGRASANQSREGGTLPPVPETLQALVVIVLGLLPGALYTWAFEQQAGPWGIGLSDRVLRFIGVSALLHAVLAPATYELWRRFIESERVAHGEALPPAVWLVPIAYVLVPLISGRIVGVGTRKRARWATFITGAAPAPTAWDHVFSTGDLEAWVRIKLTDGTWLGGVYGKRTLRSYASGYPDRRDLYLAWTALVDPATGEFEPDASGQPQLQPAGVLVRWDQVAYCLIEEFTPKS